VLVESGRAVGVVLENGEEVRAQVVVSTLHPRTAFLEQVGEQSLPPGFVADIKHWKTRSGVVKINLALAELPDFTADPGSQLQEHHTGSVEMAPTMEYIERAFTDAREGRPARFPFSDGVIPTTFDTKLCPEGSHIMSLFTQWVPADWNTEPHTAELEAYADRMIDCYNELAPNFSSSILHRDIVGPYQMEHEYGLIGGNIFHGELSLEQLFHMRPAPGYADYRTPVRGLYYGSSATHAGGGVCGIPGWQAAKAAIADKKAARRSGRCANSPGGHDGKNEAERMTRQAPGYRTALAAMLEARSVALVGASSRPGSFGARMLAEVTASPAAPEIHPVNPRYTELGGRWCHPSLADLPGPIALVTHSGSVFSAMLRTRRAIGFSIAVSSGQELVTAAPAYLDYALGLPETRVIALVLEAIRQPALFRQVLATAAERDIPVVLLTAGPVGPWPDDGGRPLGRSRRAARRAVRPDRRAHQSTPGGTARSRPRTS
jgi:hypothetical protein